MQIADTGWLKKQGDNKKYGNYRNKRFMLCRIRSLERILGVKLNESKIRLSLHDKYVDGANEILVIILKTGRIDFSPCLNMNTQCGSGTDNIDTILGRNRKFKKFMDGRKKARVFVLTEVSE